MSDDYRILARTPDARDYLRLRVADGDAQHLHARCGFEPVMPASMGMAMNTRRNPARAGVVE